jgi:hypothetical protein
VNPDAPERREIRVLVERSGPTWDPSVRTPVQTVPVTANRRQEPEMCRNIQQLRGAQPPASDDEIRDAALQFVRKVSGYREPSSANRVVFEAAVDEVAEATRRLLDGLVVGAGSKPAVPLQRRRAAALEAG